MEQAELPTALKSAAQADRMNLFERIPLAGEENEGQASRLRFDCFVMSSSLT